MALLGPAFAPHSSVAILGTPGHGPAGGAPLGLDFIGRDVLSRLLDGGRSTLLLGGAATVLIYLVGIAVGLTAGYAQSIADPLLMRTVDIFLSFPALLVMLLFVTAFGGGPVVLVGAAALVLFPGVARIVRTATTEVMTQRAMSRRRCPGASAHSRSCAARCCRTSSRRSSRTWASGSAGRSS